MLLKIILIILLINFNLNHLKSSGKFKKIYSDPLKYTRLHKYTNDIKFPLIKYAHQKSHSITVIHLILKSDQIML